MQIIRYITFKGAIRHYFSNIYSRKPPLTPFPPLCTGSLVLQYRIESCIWACGFYFVHTEVKKEPRSRQTGSSNTVLPFQYFYVIIRAQTQHTQNSKYFLKLVQSIILLLTLETSSFLKIASPYLWRPCCFCPGFQLDPLTDVQYVV